MKTKIALVLLGIVSLLGSYQLLAVAQQPSNNQQQAFNQQQSQFEYAQLSIIGEDQMVFDVGGTAIPQQRAADALYRELGGNQRPTFVNLLNVIGNDGWELVTVSNDEAVWTFRR